MKEIARRKKPCNLPFFFHRRSSHQVARPFITALVFTRHFFNQPSLRESRRGLQLLSAQGGKTWRGEERRIAIRTGFLALRKPYRGWYHAIGTLKAS